MGKHEETPRARVAAAVGADVLDVYRGWGLSGPGAARFGWWRRVGSVGKIEFLGRDVAGVIVRATRAKLDRSAGWDQ